MNNLTAGILARRSIRRYRPDPLPDEVIDHLLTAAVWAPSAHNRQPWRFAVIRRRATKERLARAMGAKLRADLLADGVPADAIERDVGRSYERLTSAPLLILVCLTMAEMDRYADAARQQNEWLMAVQSVAMAGQNLLLAAHADGLGACWLCAPLFAADAVRDILDLPADWQPQGLISVGYPAETRTKSRQPLETRVLIVD